MSGMQNVPKYKRATLIQGFRGFEGELEPYLSSTLKEHGLSEERLHFLRWLLAEEMWLVHNLFDPTHIRSHERYRVVHDKLSERLPFNLSTCFKAYFWIPVFPAQEYGVIVSLTPAGFLLDYFTNQPHTPRSF